MKYSLIFISLLISLAACNDGGKEVEIESEVAKQLEVDAKYRPMLHLFTSTNCGGCGRFGIPVFSEVAQTMGDSIFALPTHFKYQDPFINNTSLAIEKGVVNHYSSPQIWVNMKEITNSIIPYNLTTAKEKTRQFLRDEMQAEAAAFIGLESKLQTNGRFDVQLVVQKNLATAGDLFVEIYGMEDGVVASQAGADPYVSTHYRVNRGGFYGGIGIKLEIETGATFRDRVEYIPCVACASDKMYFYAIVWEETSPGRYAYVNGKMFKSQ